MSNLTESSIEFFAIELFQSLRYQHFFGPERYTKVLSNVSDLYFF